MNTPRKPDFDVAVLHKGSGMKGRIGAAWENDDGSIGIVLNPAVNLQQDGQLQITLFKRQETGFKQPSAERVVKARSTGSAYEPNSDHQDYMDSIKRNKELE